MGRSGGDRRRRREVDAGRPGIGAGQTRCIDSVQYGLGKGLVTANGEPWRAHLRIVEKAFHRSALHAMLPKFARHTAEMLDNWEARLATTKQQGAGADLATDAFVEMKHLTLDIICDTGFGFQLHSKRKGGEASDVTCAISALLMEINTRFKQMSPISNYTSCSRMREARNAWRVVNGLLTEHIESQRAQKHSSSIVSVNGGTLSVDTC